MYNRIPVTETEWTLYSGTKCAVRFKLYLKKKFSFPLRLLNHSRSTRWAPKRGLTKSHVGFANRAQVGPTAAVNMGLPSWDLQWVYLDIPQGPSPWGPQGAYVCGAHEVAPGTSFLSVPFHYFPAVWVLLCILNCACPTFPACLLEILPF